MLYMCQSLTSLFLVGSCLLLLAGKVLLGAKVLEIPQSGHCKRKIILLASDPEEWAAPKTPRSDAEG